MATITDLALSCRGRVIAQAPSGEIAPPDENGVILIVSGATWNVDNKAVLGFLDATCAINATAAGHPWNSALKIYSIGNGDATIRLCPA